MHLLAVPAVETLGQEVRCLLTFQQAARHHLKPGVYGHQVITVFYPCRRHLLVFVELDDHRRVARIRGRHLSGVTLSFPEIDVDHRFGPSSSCGRSYLEQAFDHQVARYRDVEPSGFLESLPGQLVEIGDLDLERCLQFLGSGRDELQCPHAAPSDIGETVEGGQVPHTDMMHFGPFVEHGVSPMVGQRIGYERGQAAEKPLFIGIDRQAALCGNPFYRRTERGDVVAVADIIAVEVETGFAAVSFPIGDKRADLFIP